MSQTKAIIFDCFGVLVESSYEKFKTKYFENNEAKIAEFQRIDQASSRGDMSQRSANEKFAELASIDLEQATSEISNNPPNLELLEFIQTELKPKYKIGMLSNAAENRLSTLLPANFVAIFDQIVLSCEIKLAKPDLEIYKTTADKLGVIPSECVFIDDVERYCTAAKEAGMKAIQYRNFSEFATNLSKIIGGNMK